MIMIERQKIVELSTKMVEIPSVTGRESECYAVLELAKDFLGNGVELRRIKNKTESGTTWSYLWGDENSLLTPRLLLSGHIDVVAAEDYQFRAKTEGDKLCARGAGDMKGHVASMLASYKKWLDEGGARGVGLLLTSDEEVGGFGGARYVVEHEGLRPDVVFIPDGEFDFNIVESQKAPHHFHVRALGEGGHASRAFQIDNPLNRIMKLYSAMRSKYSVATREDDWKSTFEMTVLNTKSGSANKIPSEVEAWFSWRWPLEQFSFEEGVADMMKFAKEFGCEILPDGHGMGEGCLTPRNADFVQIWKGVIEEKRGGKVGFCNMHGATDGRHFYAHKAKVLVTSGITSGAHSTKEWVDISSLVTLSEAIYDYQRKITK